MSRQTVLILPSYWASYLVNRDASGMSAEDITACDTTIARHGCRLAECVGCEDEYFSRFNDADSLHGMVCEFFFNHR